MFLKVTNAQYLHDYSLKVWFNDGTVKVVDLSGELHSEVFRPLKDKDVFRNFEIVFNTISWPNGADLAPEFLHHIGIDAQESMAS
jgi:hypothetical protein